MLSIEAPQASARAISIFCTLARAASCTARWSSLSCMALSMRQTTRVSRRRGRAFAQPQQQSAGGAQQEAARRTRGAVELDDPAVQPVLALEARHRPVQLDVFLGQDDGTKADLDAHAQAVAWRAIGQRLRETRRRQSHQA